MKSKTRVRKNEIESSNNNDGSNDRQETVFTTERKMASYAFTVVFELVPTATALARFPRHHALKYRTSLATALATAVVVAESAYFDTSLKAVYTIGYYSI